MRLVRSILWHSAALPAMERCRLLEGARSRRLEGTVLTLVEGAAAELRYAVACDAGWRTRRCTVRLETAGGMRRIVLEARAGGSWTIDGRPAGELEGVEYVDLGFSPCTNTLPIRRLALEVGASARIAVAWVRFPEFDVVRTEQAYRRLAERSYRLETGAGDFQADLQVDRAGLVTRYGELWRELTGPPLT